MCTGTRSKDFRPVKKFRQHASWNHISEEGEEK